MNAVVPPSLFFLQLPELKSLLSITLSLQPDEEPRTRQIQTCRELVLLFQDVVASPALDSFTDITALMTIPFFHKGVVQAFAHRRHLQLSPPERVYPGDLQRCLSYSPVTRLAPSWNKAGLHLVCGKDFLTERKRLNAVTGGLPPSPAGSEEVLQRSGLCSGSGLHLVPRPAQYEERSDHLHQPPAACRRSVQNLQRPAETLEPAVRLPTSRASRGGRGLLQRLLQTAGTETLHSYPLSCVRLQPVQRCARVDLQGALGCFLSHLRDSLQSVCGFPTRLTSKAQYGTLSLNPASSRQVSDGEQMNLTTSSSAIRPVLTQLPPPPPPRPGRPWFGSQPPASTPGYQQGGALELADNKRFHSRLTPSQGCSKYGGWPSSSSSSSSSSSVYSFSDFSFYEPAPCLSSSSSSSTSSLRAPLPLPFTFTSSSSPFQPASSLNSTAPLPKRQSAPPLVSTSSIPLNKPSSSSASPAPPLQTPSSLTFTSSSSPFQPASFLNSTSSLQLHRQACSFTTSSSTPHPPLPPPAAPPKVVPIFKNKHPLRHVNVALLRVQKEKEEEQMRNGGEERGRVTIPPFGRKTPVTSTSDSVPPATLPVRPPPTVPRFHCRPKRPHHSPPAPPNVRRISSLSPTSKLKPAVLLVTPRPEIKVKTTPILKTSSEKTKTKSSRDRQEDMANRGSSAAPSDPQTSCDAPTEDPSAGSVKAFEKKPKKSKPAVEDVENMARNHQLSKLSSSSLTAWLKLRGLPVSARLKKEELMLKVLSCLAEA